MSFWSRLFGTSDESQGRRSPRDVLAGMGDTAAAPNAEAQALERYRYMIKTAPPETLEQAHEEAFSRLTPDQRRKILSELAETAPAAERASIAATSSDDPRALARVATRAEVRQPGTMERTLGGGGMGMGASLLSSFAMGFAGSLVAQSFFSALGGFGGDEAGATDAPADEAAADETAFADDGGGDDMGGDFEV